MELIYKEHPLVHAGLSFESSPLGTILSFMGTKAPEGYLICDGAGYTINSYPALASFFSDQFGSTNYFGGDGVTTFAVPDLRDQFLRGFHGENETRYSGEIGAQQPGTQLPTYWGYVGSSDSRLTVVGHVGNAPSYFDRDSSESNQSSYRINAPATVVSGGQNDAMKMIPRPANVAVLYCIKAVLDVSELTLDEYDTSDGWHVRKWSDGYVEMWFRGTVTIAGGSSGWEAFGSMYVVGLSSVPLPVALVEKLSEMLTPQIGSTSGLGLWSYCTGNKTGRLLTYTEIWSICRPTQPSSSITEPYVIHVIGRWK